MFGRLHIVERGRPERIVEITGTATIGQTPDNDIVLESDGVSHCHAMLLPQHGSLLLLNLGSTFGTFVDTIPTSPDEPVHLADGAQISIGRAALRYLAPRRIAARAPADASAHPPPLARPYLNTRLDLNSDEPIRVGRRVPLLVWVGAPLGADDRQSSRPLDWSSLDDQPLALSVRVRVASPVWRVIPEQPTLLATSWGSAQVARYDLVARRPERTRLSIRVDLADSRVQLQFVRLGVSAVATNGVHVEPLPTRPALDRLQCRRCGASIRAGAHFCTQCGAKLTF